WQTVFKGGESALSESQPSARVGDSGGDGLVSAQARAAKIPIKCSLEHISDRAIFLNGCEWQNCRSSETSRRAFSAAAFLSRHAFSDRFVVCRSNNRRRLAQRRDYRIDQPANKRGKRLVYPSASPGRTSRLLFPCLDRWAGLVRSVRLRRTGQRTFAQSTLGALQQSARGGQGRRFAVA